MPAGSNQIQTTIPLQDAINKLSKYFGLYTSRDLSARIALTQLQGEIGGNRTNPDSSSFDLPPPPAHIVRIIELLIDTSAGGYTTNDIIREINLMLAGGGNNQTPQEASSLEEHVNHLVKIVYGAGDGQGNHNPRDSGVIKGSINGVHDSISEFLTAPLLNTLPTAPNRDTAPSLSGIMMNSVRTLPIHKNVNAVTIFLNGLPSLEIARCVPYLEVLFQFPRAPVNGDDRIQSMGLIKFLDGAEVAADGTRRILLNANRISSSLGEFTHAGMEVFTAPQTLVNADEGFGHDSSRRSVPVLDKFRPFMTFKDLTIDIQPSNGFMCYKSANMNFTLHDKSRVAEIADFIRPDLYTNTEILLEYGWSHPDQPSAGNSYADLLNGMRCREKYGIVNTSMTFDDAGQVNISLSLSMRGASDFRTEKISADETGASDTIRQIRSLSEQIAELRRRTFQNVTPGVREVRGVQVLNMASDSNSQLLLTPELRRELVALRTSLVRASNPSATRLLAAINNLYGTDGRSGQTAILNGSILRNIAQKLGRISRGGADPFAAGHQTDTRNINYDSATRTEIRANDALIREGHIADSVSFGALIMAFIGQPLAMTHKFDDVQIIFYPFNIYAGMANSLNIANFRVDTRFFLREYTRFRMESVARAADVTLEDFLSFVSHTLIEDHASPSYGLRGGGARSANAVFWRTPASNTAHSATAETNLPDSLALQSRIEGILRGPGGTPNGEFRMPQLNYFVECIPRARGAIPVGQSHEESNVLSILRLHIFDSHATSYDTQASLLEANRDGEIRGIGTIPPRVEGVGNPGVTREQASVASSAIAAALGAGLIVRVGTTEPPYYRISGGPQRLREFMMKTSPYIIIGAQGTAVKTAALATIQEPSLSTVNLLRSFHSDPQEPNGESPGGLPLQVIPCELSVNALGCPLLEYGTKFFVDFGTGTTIDNFYFVTGLNHKFEAGSFQTDIKFSPYDGWGRYRSLVENISNARATLQDIQNHVEVTPAGVPPRSSRR